MPSDPRTAPALAALRPRIEAFRSAVASAHHRAEGLLTTTGSVTRLVEELGAFGAGRIDPARFAAIDAGHLALDAAARKVIARAAEALGGFAVAADDLFVVDVPPGGSLHDFVAASLGNLGRAFGAAAVVELARSGRYSAGEHERFVDAYGFDRWSRGERALAPPLVVVVDGADLRAAALADFLDGAVQLAIVVRGAATPAPLARLITPATMVIQASDPAALAPLSRWSGPAVAALVGDTSARFTHDPSAGKGAWQRLAVSFRPDAPKRPVGAWSVAQQREELALLEVLATPPSLGDTPIEGLAPGRDGDPVERLASWLLTASGQAS